MSKQSMQYHNPLGDHLNLNHPLGESLSPEISEKLAKFKEKQAVIGIIGLGYVGLPLACAVCDKNFKAIGFDIDCEKIEKLNRGQSYIGNIHNERISAFVQEKKLLPTDDYSKIAECDAVILCVPTPLNKNREPDMTYIIKTTEMIAPYLQKGQLVVLESTTYPGTTKDVMRPILEKMTGLKSGVDFFLAFSPEREDPGNPHFTTSTIPKVIGGDGEVALRLAQVMYDQFLTKTITVSSTETAEAVKLTENIFRSVNIALVNELKVIYDAMGIDIWEVIEAAKTKPFGYMPFYPGPGLGGHCIPIDPFYLTWKAREFGIATRFIELAGEINVAMPHYVVGKLVEALDERFARSLNGAHVMIVGIAYKKNIADTRESPAFAVMELLRKRKAHVTFHDPFVDEIPNLREHPAFKGERSQPLNIGTLKKQDAVMIITDHDNIDYGAIAAHSKLVVDTRNALEKAGVTSFANRVKA